jgi:hypothetical protein
MNPEVPPYLALGELQRRELSQKQMATAQGAQQGPQPSVKEQVEQKAGLMALQQMQQQQMAQQQAMPRGPMPAPAGVPQPEAQPQQEMMMARGGLAGIPVRRDMFEYAGGGIIAFANGGDTMGTPSLEQQDLTSQAASITDEMVAERRNKAKLIAELEQKLAFLTNAGAPQAAEVRAQLEALKGPEAPRAAPSAPPAARQSPPPQAGAKVGAGLLEAAKAKPSPTTRIPTAMDGAPRPAAPRPVAEAPVAPAAPMPQASLPAAAQTVNPYEARLNQVALKEPVAPTTQDAISRVNELSPAAMREAALQKRNQEMRDRAAAYKEQFEKSRPSGLDDLIRVFGQSSQYKGLSGVAPAYTANKQQQRAEELAMTKQYNELMNLADTKELEGNKELFKARTGAFDTAQKLFGNEKDQVVKATASLYETTQGRINNELKMLSDKEIQMLKMAQETDIEKMRIGQRERERKSLDARDPNAKLAEYVGLKAKARELKEKGGAENIKEADRLMARAADMMEYGGRSVAAGAGPKPMTRDQASDNVAKKLEITNPNRKQIVADATQALRAAGIQNPSFSQIEEHLIQEQMKGVDLSTPSGTNAPVAGKVPPPPPGFKLN